MLMHWPIQKYTCSTGTYSSHYVCLRIAVLNIYCVVFLLCFSSSCVPYVTNFSGLSLLIIPSVFPNVYLLNHVIVIKGRSPSGMDSLRRYCVSCLGPVFLSPRTFKIIWLSNILSLRVPDKGDFICAYLIMVISFARTW